MRQTSKGVYALSQIGKLSKDFGGEMSDQELMEKFHMCKNTFYKYKKMIRDKIAAECGIEMN